MSKPCYEKPSVVAAKRLFDEGMPALPSVLFSMGVRAMLIGTGIVIARKFGAKHPVTLGLSGALVIEAALLLDEVYERQRRGR